MDSQQSSSQPVVKKVLVKRVKVLVKRPVAAAPSAAAPQPTTTVKVPVKRVVSPAAPQTAQPAPAAPAAKVSASGRKSYVGQVIDGVTIKPIVFKLPENIFNAVKRRKKIPQKILSLYIYARVYAQRVAEEAGERFPALRVELPEDTLQMAEIMQNLNGGTFLDNVFSDFNTIAPFIKGFAPIVTSQLKPEELIPAGLDYLRGRNIGYDEQIILAYLDVLLDLNMLKDKKELKEAKQQAKQIVDDIRKLEKKEENMRNNFIKAIERKHFPVDAKKLINNYFTLAKKEPEKAYETLITNPLFFSPILIEKMPKKFFGLAKPTPQDAQAVNKQLASFLKKLKA
ncbi:MAG: hypothetical protein J5716_05315 [Alphaproteobacteria bacterium]|nr:hypothetical protein [Alphaproteobacteria bacterium]